MKTKGTNVITLSTKHVPVTLIAATYVAGKEYSGILIESRAAGTLAVEREQFSKNGSSMINATFPMVYTFISVDPLLPLDK